MVVKIKRVYFFFFDTVRGERRSVLWSNKKDAEDQRKTYFKKGYGVGRLKSKVTLMKPVKKRRKTK